MAHDRREGPRCLAAPSRTETAARISVRCQRRIWGGRDNGPLEITHQRASYAVVLAIDARVFWKSEFWRPVIGEHPPRRSRCVAAHFDPYRSFAPGVGVQEPG